MKAFILLALFPLAANAQVLYDYTATTLSGPFDSGSVLLASELPSDGVTTVNALSNSFVHSSRPGWVDGLVGDDFIFMTDNGHITQVQLTPLSEPNTPSADWTFPQGTWTMAAADPPAPTFAVFTTESHTGGGGMLEGTLMLMLMGGAMLKRWCQEKLWTNKQQ